MPLTNMAEMAAPAYEISNQILRELIRLKKDHYCQNGD